MQGFREKLQGLENLAASARAGRYQPTVPGGGALSGCAHLLGSCLFPACFFSLPDNPVSYLRSFH